MGELSIKSAVHGSQQSFFIRRVRLASMYYHFFSRLICLTFLIYSSIVFGSSPVVNFRLDLAHHDISINDDLTWSREVTLKYTVLTPVGAEALQKRSHSFYSENETFDILEAKIISPEGKTFPVEKENIFDQDLGGHDKDRRARENVVIFSRLTPGSQLTLKYRHNIHKAGPMGINLALAPDFGVEQKSITSTIKLPPNTPMNWGERGGFQIVSKTENNRKTLDIRLDDIPYMEPEINMVDASDVLPIFAITSTQNWEDIGKTYYKNSLSREADTADIHELADSITDAAKTTSEKARKIYTWVAKNINYLSISYNLEDNLVPHQVEDIIRHGYGDCKDQTLLLQTLLKAKGIYSEAALVDWSNSYSDLPVPSIMQFNHIVLYIPELDIFLNPVTPFLPFGVLDDSLTEKRVVFATPEGRVGRLPAFSAATNSYRLDNHSELRPDGSLIGTTTVSGTGIIDLQIREILASWGSGEWKANSILADSDTGGFGQITDTTSPYELDTIAEYKGHWHSPKAFTLGKYSFITAPAGLGFKDATALRKFLVEKKRKFPFQVGPPRLSVATHPDYT